MQQLPIGSSNYHNNRLVYENEPKVMVALVVVSAVLSSATTALAVEWKIEDHGSGVTVVLVIVIIATTAPPKIVPIKMEDQGNTW